MPYRKVRPFTFFERAKPWFFVVVGSLSFYGGTWQIKRRKQKIEYIDLIKERTNSPAVECPMRVSSSILDKRKYTKVKVTGVPRFEDEIVVGPRKPPPSSAGIDQGGWGGYVHTPVDTANGLVSFNLF